ncbi:MAG: glycosyltransferase family 4 protein [Sulfurimonas sp.]|nr:glycosyltransferase family 4 protein [Sulfurimonas sp.]
MYKLILMLTSCVKRIVKKCYDIRFAYTKSVVVAKKCISADFKVKYVSTDKEHVVDIVNVNFFDWNGQTLYKGGAERYVLDLAKLIERSGRKARIIQNANTPFVREYQGLEVIGIPARSGWNFRKLYSHYLTDFDHSGNIIVSPLDIACISSDHNVIGINHGIHWDNVDNYWGFNDNRIRNNIVRSLEHIRCGVCVDTNFINWTRTFDYRLSTKLRYLPNYFDEAQFAPSNKDFSDDEITILYPRRLYAPRGFYLMSNILDALLNKYHNVRIHFVGQALEPETSIINLLVEKYGNAIKWYELEMEQMDKAYLESQIVLVPTVNSEGTSLSCIEALATNNAVIATNIGGLPNLIIDGFNGLLIEPSENALLAALEYLIENRSRRIELAQNGLVVSKAFTKNVWESRWKNIMDEFLI